MSKRRVPLTKAEKIIGGFFIIVIVGIIPAALVWLT